MQINFEIEPGKEGDRLARFKFWDSPNTAQWFKGHGYTLYKRVKESAVLRPALPSEFRCDNAEYPYGHFDSSKSRPSSDPLEVYERWGKVAYAQDSANRHVVIKIVPKGTEEYRILEFLKAQTLEDLKENCVMPVLDLLPIEGYYFAVMPRWGFSIDVPYMQDIQEVIIIIHSLLKGLAYLHGRNIVHGVDIFLSSGFRWGHLTLPSQDISHQNFLTNHFSGGLLSQNEMRRDLRSTKRLLYAIIDFDFAVMVTPEQRKRGFRIQYDRLARNRSPIKDMQTGKFDIDPFAYDVGVMGALICRDFQHLSHHIPLLAPLLDRMTTWELERRFTAQEALCFFEEGLFGFTKDHFTIPVVENHKIKPYDEYNRWQTLPLDLVQEWSAHKTPVPPWRIVIIRRLYKLPYFSYIIPTARSYLRSISQSLFG